MKVLLIDQEGAAQFISICYPLPYIKVPRKYHFNILDEVPATEMRGVDCDYYEPAGVQTRDGVEVYEKCENS